MGEDRVAVRNAADPKQVKRAARKDRDRSRDRENSLRAVLATRPGRDYLWALLETAGVFRSVYDSTEKIRYNAGRQDFGHELMAEIIRASPEGFELMQHEQRLLAKREAAELDAAHTPNAEEETQS